MAKGAEDHNRPSLIMEGHGKRTDGAHLNVSNWILLIRWGPSWFLTFPLQVLVCGLLLPLVVVEAVWALTLSHSRSAKVVLFRKLTGLAPYDRRRTTVAPLQRSEGQSRGLPDSDDSVLKPVKPSVLAWKKTIHGVDTTAIAAAKISAAVPFRPGSRALERPAGAPIARLLWGCKVLAPLVAWTLIRPVQKAVSMTANWARGVDDRVRRTTLTISIEDAAVRMVVFRRREVIAWRSAWIGDEFGPMAGPKGARAGESRDRVTPSLIKRLIQGYGRHHVRVVVDLPAYTSLIRNLTMTKMGRRYLGPIVESELLESLPFGKNQVDLSWCARPSPGSDQDRLEVFALAVPRLEMDWTAGLLVDSGISPSAAYAKSTTLVYAVGVPTSLIIHFEGDVAAIVPVLHGRPWVVHQVACPRDVPGSDVGYQALNRGVEQVAAFSPALPGPEDPGDDLADHPLAPAVLTGDVLGAGIDTGQLEEILQRPVSTLQASVDRRLDHPPNFPVAQYASNIGLFLADRAGIRPWQIAFRRDRSPKIRRNALPGLNVLAKRHMPPPLPPLLVPVFIALLLSAAGTVPLWEKTNTMVDGAQAMEVRLDFLQGQAKQRRSMVDRELQMTGELQATIDETASLESQLKETQLDMQTLLARLQAITLDTESHGVSLYGLNPEEGGFAISGTAESHDDVLRYAQAVRDSGHFGDAQVTGLEGLGNESGGRITFRILAMDPVPPQDNDQVSSTAAPETSAGSP